MSDDEVRRRLSDLGISNSKPMILQVSRFDRLKDPLGVIRAYEVVRRSFDCQLILAGGGALDDPEGEGYFQEVCRRAEGIPDLNVLHLPPDSDTEINALQRAATVVVQKSLREGFGLTITEAMWKGKPVVGGAVGGIRRQILEGVNGFLVESPEGAAFRIRLLLADPELRRKMGAMGRELVRQNFLMAHYLKNWLLVLHGLRHREKAIVHFDDIA
jgi:trehalose synthase